MSTKSQTQNLARNDGINTIATDQSPKYTPQFSAATQMILERIHSGNSGSFSSIGISAATVPPPGYEDMRRSVLQTMRTSMNMNIPVTPSREKKKNLKYPRSTGGSGSGLSTYPNTTPAGSFKKGKITRKSRSKTGGKRKRMKDKSEDSDEESDDTLIKLDGDSDLDDSDAVTKFPKMTQSGRYIVKPTHFVPATSENHTLRRTPTRKAQEQALCKRCGRSHSPENNMIVFCDGCNLPWHQDCHSPLIPDEVVRVESTLWFCADCSRKKGIKSGYEDIPKGVSWARKGIEEKKAFLSSQSHSQLVTLLLQATYLHPDIPLFPWPETKKTHSHSQYQQTRSFYSSTPSTAGRFSQSDTNTPASINLPRKKQSPAPQASISSMHTSSTTSMASTQDCQLSRESTPASPPYPRPGNGLMAKIGPDDVDIDWLADGDDYEAFSHTLVDNYSSYGSDMNSISTVGTRIVGVNVVHEGVDLNGMSIRG